MGALSLAGNTRELLYFFAFSRLRENQKKDRRMGISARAVTIWASSARRVPRNDPNFVRILAWATLRCPLSPF